MANEVGTASNLEDFFGKIVNFLTANASLVAANQEWEVLRIARDNLAAVTTNLTTTSNLRACMRSDPRTLNTDADSFYENLSGFSAGVSHVTCELKQAREVKKVRLSTPNSSTGANDAIKNFRLQYSDDGISWTTALTVTGVANWSISEVRDYEVPGTPGAHLYWRVLGDSLRSGSTWRLHTLQLLDGSGAPANNFGSEVLLKGRGHAGTDEIYIGIRSEYNEVFGWYNLFLNGYTGFDPSVYSFWEHPGGIYGATSPFGSLSVPSVPLWNDVMPFWFAASGRSFRMGVKVGTSYEAAYLGFFLPYATPGQYPYPLLIGGTLCTDITKNANWRYSYQGGQHSGLQNPGTNTSSGGATSTTTDSAMYYRDARGQWVWVGGRSSSDGRFTMNRASSPPYAVSGLVGRYVLPSGYRSGGSAGWEFRENLDGSYCLIPLTLVETFPYPAAWGELEGVFHISGFGNAAENVVTKDGNNLVVLQNCSRTTVSDFWALELTP